MTQTGPNDSRCIVWVLGEQFFFSLRVFLNNNCYFIVYNGCNIRNTRWEGNWNLWKVQLVKQIRKFKTQVQTRETPTTGGGFSRVVLGQPAPIPQLTRALNPCGFTNPSYSLLPSLYFSHISQFSPYLCWLGGSWKQCLKVRSSGPHVDRKLDQNRPKRTRLLVPVLVFENQGPIKKPVLTNWFLQP